MRIRQALAHAASIGQRGATTRGTLKRSMSAVGQKQKYAGSRGTSVFPSMNEPASQERAARGAGGGDGVTR
jgi:hypothetical protein